MSHRKEKEPKFKPKKGQVDFRNARWAPVVNCVVRHGGKILLVKRSSALRLYPGYWNGISGFLDDHKSLEEKVREELREEVGIASRHIKRIRVGRILLQEAPKYRKTWIIHPVLVDVSTDRVKLDWEAHEYRWVKPSAAKKLRLLPGFADVLRAVAVAK